MLSPRTVAGATDVAQRAADDDLTALTDTHRPTTIYPSREA
jgi:hypothetical protein